MAATGQRVTLQFVFAGDAKPLAKTTSTVGGQLEGLRNKVKAFAPALASGLSVAAVVRYGRQAVGSYKQVTGEVAQLKRVTGESAENASLLRFAAQQSGIDVAKMATAWGIFSKNIASGAVEKAGIDIRDTNGELLASEDILGRVADRFASMPDGPEKTALALKLFGRGGAEMIKVLNRGSAGIEDLRAEMRKLGMSVTDEDLAKLKDYTAAQRDWAAASAGLKQRIGGVLLPLFTSLAKAGSEDLPVVADGIEKVTGALSAVGDATGLGSAVGSIAAPIVAGGVAVAGLGAAVLVLTPALSSGWAALTGLAGGAANAAAALVGTTFSTTGLIAEETTATATTNVFTTALTAEAGAATLASSALAGVVAGISAYNLTYKALESGTGFSGDLQALTEDLGQVGKGVSDLQPIFDQYGGSADSLAGKIKRLRAEENKSTGTKVGDFFRGQAVANARDGKKLQNELKALDGAFATVAKGNVVEGKKSFAEFRDAMVAQGVEVEDLALLFPKYYAAVERAERSNRKAAIGANAAARGYLNEAGAAKRAEQSVADLYAQTTKTRSLQQSVADAHENTADAVDRLAEAHRAAEGDSDEYRSALQAEADAIAAIPDAIQAEEDARQGVADAIQSERDAVQSLADARKAELQAAADEAEAVANLEEAHRRLTQEREDAILTVQELANAVTDARLKESQAAIDTDKAAIERRRANAGLRSDIDRRQAEQDYQEALAAQRAAAIDRVRAETENRRVGGNIENVDGVVSARQGVTDAEDALASAHDRVASSARDTAAAERGVEAAHRGVEAANRDLARSEADTARARAAAATAGADAAKVLTDAKATVVTAEREVQGAVEDEAQKWADLTTETDGATAGVMTHIAALDTLMREHLAPGSPGYQALEAYMRLLAGDLQPLNTPRVPSLGSAPPGATNAERQDRSSRRGGKSGPTFILQGTPTQQRRALEATARKIADRDARGQR